jgi:hypothetical protein
MNDSFNGDLLPFIQDSIRRGYAKPNWYLIVVEHGFEITQGNVMGLGDANFSVTVGGFTVPIITSASPPPAPAPPPARTPPSARTPTLPLMTASLARSLAERMVASKTHRHPHLNGRCRGVNRTTARCHLAWTVRASSYTATGKIWDWLSSGTAYWSYNFHGRRTSKRCTLLHPMSRRCWRSFHLGSHRLGGRDLRLRRLLL